MLSLSVRLTSAALAAVPGVRSRLALGKVAAASLAPPKVAVSSATQSNSFCCCDATEGTWMPAGCPPARSIWRTPSSPNRCVPAGKDRIAQALMDAR